MLSLRVVRNLVKNRSRSLRRQICLRLGSRISTSRRWFVLVTRSSSRFTWSACSATDHLKSAVISAYLPGFQTAPLAIPSPTRLLTHERFIISITCSRIPRADGVWGSGNATKVLICGVVVCAYRRRYTIKAHTRTCKVSRIAGELDPVEACLDDRRAGKKYQGREKW